MRVFVCSDHATKPSPISALCSQIHRLLTVLVPLLRMWVHCSRASNGSLPPRSYPVGYVRWDARSVLPPLSDNQFQQLFRSQPRCLDGLPRVTFCTARFAALHWGECKLMLANCGRGENGRSFHRLPPSWNPAEAERCQAGHVSPPPHRALFAILRGIPLWL